LQPSRRKILVVDQDTDAILYELLCEYLDVLPDAPSPEVWAIDARPDALDPDTITAPGDELRFGAHLVPRIRSSLISARQRGELLREGELSPYETRLIVEDALRAGTGAQLAVELADVQDPSVCVAVRNQLTPLVRRGVQVRVRCDRDECRHGTPGAAA
jgi:hypothetical protein